MNGRALLVLALLAAAAGAAWLVWRHQQNAGQGTAGDSGGGSDQGGGTLADLAVSPSSSLLDLFAPFTSYDNAAAAAGASDVSSWAPPSRAAAYIDAINQAELANGIPHGLLAREIQQESNFDPNARNARSGATGLCQILPSTAADPGYGVDPCDPTDAYDSIRFMGQYLAALYQRTGTWSKALAAYNWGLGFVLRSPDPSGWPRETQNYVAAITADVSVA